MKNTANPLPSYDELQAKNLSLQEELAHLKNQLQWFKTQLFGAKSERRIVEENAAQGVLMGLFDTPPPIEPSESTAQVKSHERKKHRKDTHVTDTGLRFDDTVPVQEILVLPAELTGPDASQYETAFEQVTYRLAQQKASYVVLKYVHPVVRHKASATLIQNPAPTNVLERSLADVSFIAGMLVDKFTYHQPLYRLHQKLLADGIDLSRQTLTNIAQQGIELLKPIVDAMLEALPASPLLAMDETHILAGRKKKGKMHQAYLWPIYSASGDVVFTYSDSRSGKHLKILDDFEGILLTDGYEAYASYVKRRNLLAPLKPLTHALCWVHARRTFVKAEASEPQAAAQALEYIRVLYTHEEFLRETPLLPAARLQYRQDFQKPVVDAFFQWCREQLRRSDLTPKMPLTKALKYVLDREGGLRVFLSHSDVQIDTNHLERALRVIPMGRKNWNFCWTELGAKHVAIIQSLLVTCRLHGVDAYTYLVDVLQRVGMHPASRVHELTPQEWKKRFADNPLLSDVNRKIGGNSG